MNEILQTRAVVTKPALNPQLCFSSSSLQVHQDNSHPLTVCSFWVIEGTAGQEQWPQDNTAVTASCPLPFAGPGCRDSWKGLQVKLWEWGHGRVRKSSARYNVSPVLIDEGNSMILILRHSNGDLNSASAVLSFVDKDLQASCPLDDPRVSDFKFLTRWCWEMWAGRAEGTWR